MAEKTVALILLPGLDGTGQLFAPLLEHLPDWIKPVVVTYPRDEALGYRDLQDIAVRALPADTEFVILGESFSGPLAVMMAAEKPAGLRGIVLCASFVKKPFRTMPAWFRVFSVAPIYRFWPATIRFRALLAGKKFRALADAANDAIRSVSPAVIARRVQAVLSVDVERQLIDLDLPVLYLAGRQDRLIRRHNLAGIKAVKPELRVAEIDTRHFVLQLEPGRSAAAIEQFIVSIDRA